ncbi:diphthine--ammonia ligase-like [Silene latifolia]|uniref:diphthine--ammonia ligase-like n=1 Tax=Silene latifolia TaxID=37657 RepID=UPI003D771001
MKVVALVSGGKDSCYAMMQCIHYGHEIVALANLMPVDDSVDELDSYMYQTVGHQIVVSYAKCMGIPLFRRRLQGSTRHHALSYTMTPGDEVEDMFALLAEVKRQIPSVTAVSSGAIASDYQRLRVENICARLGLVSLAYLWKQEQSPLFQEMITSGIIAIIVKVAAIGLNPAKHLGKELDFMKSHLHHLNGLYGINVCGEGGEYETLTLDCPLFKFARIVLDDFQIVLHSSDSIAPVGVLHPVAFHLEPKLFCTDSTGSSIGNNICLEDMNCVYEVEGDNLLKTLHQTQDPESLPNLMENASCRVHTSKTGSGDTFSIGCWLKDPSRTSPGLQDDLKTVLSGVESELKQHGLGWECVIYVHLYIADMNEFALANETYVSFITQEKCSLGVPSRSTIELPLSQVGLGKAYVEVLASRDQAKRVLHVQSISSWAPSCIGPYSQATLHHGILHMAGQIGLDPPTMALCNGGLSAELEQALLNSEAVAECFNCSISTAAIAFIIYCSSNILSEDRAELHEKWEGSIGQLKKLHSVKRRVSKVVDPVLLFVLVPDLPKRALVEVKPILFVMDDSESTSDVATQDQAFMALQNCWGFQQETWHETLVQKCVVVDHICLIMLAIANDDMAKICQDTLIAGNPLSQEQAEKIAKFCIYLINRFLAENLFTWENAMYLRLYYQAGSVVQMETLSLAFSIAFQEFADANPDFKSSDKPIFNLVPVLGTGRRATSIDTVLTCELLAQKPPSKIID